MKSTLEKLKFPNSYFARKLSFILSILEFRSPNLVCQSVKCELHLNSCFQLQDRAVTGQFTVLGGPTLPL